MSDRYKHLMHLDQRELHNYLTKRGDPPLIRQQIFDCVVAQQQRRANSKRRDAQVIRWWEPIAGELTNEIKVVRAMQQHDRGNEQRQEVLAAYMAVLHKVRGEIQLAKVLSLTPNGLQAWRVENGKPRFPNELSHWVDMVPEKIQERIHAAFDGLPYKARAKRKTPFPRD